MGTIEEGEEDGERIREGRVATPRHRSSLATYTERVVAVGFLLMAATVVVKERLEKAGIRLAMILNGLWP